MRPVQSFPKIAIDETLRETASHGNAIYPFQYYLEDVWAFDLHCIDWHWHAEPELVYVSAGEVTCSAGGERHTLPKGWGMYINSRVVHRFTAEASAVMPNCVFSPVLLAAEDSLIYRKYVLPVLQRGLPYVLLSPTIDWQANVLRIITAIFALHERPQPSEIEVLRLLLEMWEALLPHVVQAQDGGRAGASMEQARMQRMLQYVHDHYAAPVTLDDIAGAVYISKSSALQIFQSGMQTTPIAYLVQYRLKCAARLLRSTEKSVSAIAQETGHKSAGYFCKRFKALYGVSPNAYRRAGGANNNRY